MLLSFTEAQYAVELANGRVAQKELQNRKWSDGQRDVQVDWQSNASWFDVVS